MRYTLVAGAVATLVLGACTPTVPTPPASPSLTTTGRPVTMADAQRCPVTLPSWFVPPSGVAYEILFGAENSYGNGQLWVGGLPDKGVLIAGSMFLEPDGSIGTKFGWYRATSGRLIIAGRRLDATAPPARESVPDGYGDTGFQSSGVYFPTEGCWEITGTVGPTTLTFVTFVIKGT